MSQGWKRALDWAYYLVAVFFFVYLFAYYSTSRGGPALLAFALVPVTFILYTLEALRKDELYPSLPAAANLLTSPVLEPHATLADLKVCAVRVQPAHPPAHV